MFEQVKIVLINTTHPGNIGAVARAMKNMGFRQLCLVAPKHFPADEATARASGADDILEHATLVDSLEEALVGCHWVAGLSARQRRVAWPTLLARDAAVRISQEIKTKQNLQVALLFGQEQSGLSNEEMARCHFQITIPADSDYASLNLAQAVQIITYELRMAFLADTARVAGAESGILTAAEEIATADEMESFYTHLEATLIQIRLLNPEYPGYLMAHLRRLYSKGGITKTELNILRGILTATQKMV